MSDRPNSTNIAVSFSNGRRDPGLRYYLKYVPGRADDAVKELERLLANAKAYQKRVKKNPEKFDLDREKL
jgi:hypothetical protein